MEINERAQYLISIIEAAGYQAFVVGGCVRDYIMSRPCDDIDITTSALPFEVEKILDENGIGYYETGLKHGTITAVIGNQPFEITTFRRDGAYNDSRHPEEVCFVTDIRDDLSRRDFTINAMAYNEKTGLVDEFGGIDDINNGIIRTVGDADKRFKEDALRIMRAIRFSSTLGFRIDEETAAAALRNKELLLNVSSERIFAELSGLLLGDNVFEVLTGYRDIIAVIIPELKPTFDCEQNTKWHLYDVWTHTCKTIESAPRELAIRLTMLLHDIGKPFVKKTDDCGVDHFKGHQRVSADMAEIILKRFKVSNELYNRVMAIIPIHDVHIGTDRKYIKRWLRKIGEKSLLDLVAVKRADKLGQNLELTLPEAERLEITQLQIRAVIDEGEPFTVKDLKVNGNDLIALGYEGREIGKALERVLELVIDNELDNDYQSIIRWLDSGEIDEYN